MFSVYCHTNLKNGKKYVGITSQDPEKRWLSGKGYSRNQKFYRDIKKYGWDKFSHEILADNLTEDEAVKKEQDLIKSLNTVADGYNNSYGGMYPRKSFLSHESNQIKHGLKKYISHYPQIQGVIDTFVDAEKDELLATTVNGFVENILQLFAQDHYSPCYESIDFLLDFVWEYRRIWSLHAFIHLIDDSEEASQAFLTVFPKYNSPYEDKIKWLSEYAPRFGEKLKQFKI